MSETWKSAWTFCSLSPTFSQICSIPEFSWVCSLNGSPLHPQCHHYSSGSCHLSHQWSNDVQGLLPSSQSSSSSFPTYYQPSFRIYLLPLCPFPVQHHSVAPCCLHRIKPECLSMTYSSSAQRCQFCPASTLIIPVCFPVIPKYFYFIHSADLSVWTLSMPWWAKQTKKFLST